MDYIRISNKSVGNKFTRIRYLNSRSPYFLEALPVSAALPEVVARPGCQEENVAKSLQDRLNIGPNQPMKVIVQSPP